VAAFDADHQRQAAVALRGADAGAVGAERDRVGAAAGLFVDDPDELAGEVRRAAVGVERRHVRGKEGGGDAALLQRAQVGLRFGVVLVEMHVVAEEAVRRVAVAVDDDRAPVEVTRGSSHQYDRAPWSWH
jgi:hypothetical protein